MTHKRNNRYQTLSNEELVSRALEMKAEITYRKRMISRELTKLEKAAKLFRNLGATRLARACGSDPVTIEAIANMSEPDVAERAAQAIADRRWNEVHSPSGLRSVGTGQPTTGGETD